MKLRMIASVLIVSVALPATASAQSIRSMVAGQAASTAGLVTQAPATNPYKVPAIALMAGGAGLLVLGLMQERGVRTEGDIFDSQFAVKETGGSKTALTVLGVVTAGAGAGLWFWGENKKNRPSLSITPKGAQLRVRF